MFGIAQSFHLLLLDLWSWRSCLAHGIFQCAERMWSFVSQWNMSGFFFPLFSAAFMHSSPCVVFTTLNLNSAELLTLFIIFYGLAFLKGVYGRNMGARALFLAVKVLGASREWCCIWMCSVFIHCVWLYGRVSCFRYVRLSRKIYMPRVNSKFCLWSKWLFACFQALLQSSVQQQVEAIEKQYISAIEKQAHKCEELLDAQVMKRQVP